MTDPRISVHLITWGQDFKKGLREASELGFRACETFTHTALEYEDRPGEFTDLLAEHGMKLSALYGGGRFGDPAVREDTIASNERVAKFLSAIGCDRIVFGPGGPRTEGGSTAEELETMVGTINEAAKRCLDLGVKACVHPHVYTEIQERSEIDYVMENTDASTVWFCPDTAHLAKVGMDPAELIRTYADRMAYMHLKDVTPAEAKLEDFPGFTHAEALPIFCELGLGTVDLADVAKSISDIGYDGWLTVEIDMSTSTPAESLRICRDYVEKEWGIQIQGREV